MWCLLDSFQANSTVALIISLAFPMSEPSDTAVIPTGDCPMPMNWPPCIRKPPISRPAVLNGIGHRSPTRKAFIRLLMSSPPSRKRFLNEKAGPRTSVVPSGPSGLKKAGQITPPPPRLKNHVTLPSRYPLPRSKY